MSPYSDSQHHPHPQCPLILTLTITLTPLTLTLTVTHPHPDPHPQAWWNFKNLLKQYRKQTWLETNRLQQIFYNFLIELRKYRPISKCKVCYGQKPREISSNTIMNIYISVLTLVLKYIKILEIITSSGYLESGLICRWLIILWNFDWFSVKFLHISGLGLMIGMEMIAIEFMKFSFEEICTYLTFIICE